MPHASAPPPALARPATRVLTALLLAAAAVMAGRPLAAQPDHRPDPARIERQLRPAVRLAGRPDTAFDLVDRMRFYHVPGVSIAVVDDFRIVYARGYGVTEFGGSQRVDTATLFQAGSISKPVFATGVLALVDQGRVSLDEDINHYLTSWHLPESRFTQQEKVTLRRILSHSAGLTVWGFPGYEAGKPVPTVAQLLDGAPPSNTQAVRNDTTPGARWLYSGGGVTVAQLAVSDVTGEPFPALMRRLVLDRAGMRRSTYEQPLPPARAGEAASGHELPDTPVPGRYHTYPEMAAAGLWTTPADLARWAIAVARSYRGDTGALLPQATARQMLTRQVQVGPPMANPAVPTWWGLGLELRGEGDSLLFGHSGRDEGFIADLSMSPVRGRGLIIMINGVNGGLMNEIRRAFNEEYGIANPRPEKAVVAADPASLAPLVGRYRMVAGRDTITYDVTMGPGGLTLANSLTRIATRLWPQGTDTFFSLDNGVSYGFDRGGAGPTAPASALLIGQEPGRRVAPRVDASPGAP